ncbi:MAG: DNA-processing protein DprA [Candidatus Omnitrophica bacterium]|nr:DNA-processing protein DprA [Candidatus Omnitrophota bacterium]
MTDPISPQDLKAFLTLNHLRIEGRRRVMALLEQQKAAQEILEIMTAEGFFNGTDPKGALRILSPERELDRCIAENIRLFPVTDPAYPRSLKEIADPPLVLYLKGAVEETDQNAVAIVGTRHPSFYGRTQARRFGKGLADQGLTIVSGMARGIDQAAHEAALEVSYGRTLAVLGSGLDVVYPKENEGLYERIVTRGAVLSEYPLGTPPLPENFPRRNRIISGLCYGVLVIEAHSRSGSLITAHQAADQGREVFALPGPVDQLTSRGTHRLLKEGACLVEGPEDIGEVLAGTLKRENHFSRPADEDQDHSPDGGCFSEATLFLEAGAGSAVVEACSSRAATGASLDEEAAAVGKVLREKGPLSAEGILDAAGLDPRGFPALLLRLELARKIKRDPGGQYSAYDA